MSFHLVQRLEAAPDGQPQNVFGSDIGVSKVLLDAGAGVDLACMGSSEFEMGAVAESGNRIASVANRLKIVTQQLVRPSYTEDVHFVVTDEQVEDTLPEWHTWAEGNPRSLDPTGYFREFADFDVYSEDTIAWWALRENLIWSREEKTAENIRVAFVNLTSK